MSESMSRRSALGLGAGALAGAMVTGLSRGQAGAIAISPEELLAPLSVGARFARWKVARINPIEDGALSLVVRAEDGHEFMLEVLERDTSPLSPRPPAEVGELAVYVCNAGDGWLPTVEEQGLAAMTLAQVLENNGKGARVEGLQTHAQRIAQYGARIRGQQPSAPSV
jgi:hypothetical protein